MKRIALLLLTFAMSLGLSAGPQLQAQESEPALVVSVASLDSLGEGLDALSAALGPDVAGMLAMAPTELPGVDGTKPAGLVVTVGEAAGPGMPDIQALAFLPVNDLDSLLQVVGGMMGGPAGPALPEPDADGVYEIDAGMQSVFALQEGDWLFLTNNRDTLDATPTDPTTLLGGLDEQYSLAVKLLPANVPESAKQMAMGMISMGAGAAEARMPGESDAQYAMRSAVMERSMAQLGQLLNETEALVIGLGIDAQTPALSLETVFTAVAGTALADQLALVADATTDFAGFFSPDAAVALQAAGQITDEDAEQFQAVIDMLREQAADALDEQDLNGAESDLAKQIVGDLFDVVSASLAEKRMDIGGSLLVDSDSVVLVTAMHVAEASKLEGVLKQLATLATQDNPMMDQVIALDVEEHQGVRLHMATMPQNVIDAPGMPPIFSGKTAGVVIGFSDDAVYLSAGIDPMDALKAAIDASQADAGQPVPPSQVTLSLSQLAQIVEHLAPPDALEEGALILEAMSQAAPADHVTIQTEVIPNGAKSTITVEAGVVSVIFAAVMVAQEAASSFGEVFEEMEEVTEEVDGLDADPFGEKE